MLINIRFEIYTIDLQNCLSENSGKAYGGTLSISGMGHHCLNWTDVASVDVKLNGNFIDGSIEAAEDHCRNPNGDVSYPWCYVAPYETRQCYVPYCRKIFLCSIYCAQLYENVVVV